MLYLKVLVTLFLVCGPGEDVLLFKIFSSHFKQSDGLPSIDFLILQIVE